MIVSSFGFQLPSLVDTMTAVHAGLAAGTVTANAANSGAFIVPAPTTVVAPPASVPDPIGGATYYKPPDDYQDLITESKDVPWYQTRIPLIVGLGGVGLILFMGLRAHKAAAPMQGYRRRRRHHRKG